MDKLIRKEINHQSVLVIVLEYQFTQLVAIFMPIHYHHYILLEI